MGGPLTGPTSYVYSLSVSPDGRTLAAAVVDHAVWLWDISDPAHPALLADLAAATGVVSDVTFSPNGHTLVASGSDQVLTFWDYHPSEGRGPDLLADRKPNNARRMGRVRAGRGVLSALPLNLVEPTVRPADWLLGRVGPVVPALVGAACISSSAIVVQLAHTEAGTTAFLRCVLALPGLYALALWEQRRYGRRSARDRLMAAFAGAFLGGDLVLWTHSIYDVGAGIATVLGNLQVLFVTTIAWVVLRERPRKQFLVALPVVLGGVVLLAGVIGHSRSGEHPVGGVLYGLGTSVCYAIFILVLRRNTKGLAQIAGPLADATLGAALASLVLGLAFRATELPYVAGGVWLVGPARFRQPDARMAPYHFVAASPARHHLVAAPATPACGLARTGRSGALPAADAHPAVGGDPGLRRGADHGSVGLEPRHRTRATCRVTRGVLMSALGSSGALGVVVEGGQAGCARLPGVQGGTLPAAPGELEAGRLVA